MNTAHHAHQIDGRAFDVICSRRLSARTIAQGLDYELAQEISVVLQVRHMRRNPHRDVWQRRYYYAKQTPNPQQTSPKTKYGI